MPHLTIDTLNKEKVSDGVYKVTAVVGNLGYLPTYLSEEAISLNVAESVTVSITGAQLVSGKPKEDAGMLSGWSRTITGSIYGNLTTMANAPAKKKISWVVKAEEGTTVEITASHVKSGTCTKTITL